MVKQEKITKLPITYPIRKEVMDNLRKTYIYVKHHPYRLDRIGSPKTFKDGLHNMSDALSEALWCLYRGEKNIRQNTKEMAPRRFSEMFHDFNALIGIGNEEIPEEIMRVFEHYISMAHDFIDTKEWLKFKVYNRKADMWFHYEYHEDVNLFELSDDFIKDHGNRHLKGWRQWRDGQDDQKWKDAMQKDIDRLEYRMKKLGIPMEED